MEAHPEVVVAGGNCNAYAGIGDPYLPFVEALRLLSGDVEAQRAAGALSREHARRLQGLTPHTLRAVLESGPALINVLLPGVSLLERARALPDAGTWVARVQEALGLRVTAPAQASLFDQVTRVLQRLAQQHPLIVILDDLQWADAASISSALSPGTAGGGAPPADRGRVPAGRGGGGARGATAPSAARGAGATAHLGQDAGGPRPGRGASLPGRAPR